MTEDQAERLLRMIDVVDPYARKLSPEDQSMRAAAAALAWSRVDAEWGVGWVRAELAAGNVPSVPAVAAAWRTEAARRVDVPVPDAATEVEVDGRRWVAWEQARRRALLDGQTALAAVQTADRLVGAAPRLAIPAGGTGPVHSARIDALIDALTVRQAARRADLDVNDADEAVVR